MGSECNVHVIVFPFLSKSHTFPLIDLSKALSRRGAKITIITTPKNSPSINACISQFPNIHLKILQFPCVEGLPKGCENTSQLPSMQFFLKFISATKLLQEPFEKALLEMFEQHCPPTCVISDTFLGWTKSTCRKLGIPRISFNGMGVFAMFVKKYLSIHQTNIWDVLDTDCISIEDMQKHGLTIALKKSTLPRSLRVNDDLSEFFVESEKSDIGSWGAIANSFLELESRYVDPLSSLYGVDASLFCVGPLYLLDEVEGSTTKTPKPTPSTIWAKWLDQQTQMNSVIYVSFGTQSNLDHTQLDELAIGLEMSGYHYIWVIRSEDWNPPVQERGLITRDFVDQKWVLTHNSVGGFLSHCGWNSVLEGISAQLPILAWPLEHEQPLNAKYLVEELKAGLHIPGWTAGKHIVRREAICQGVKELMGGEDGKLARKNASKLGDLAKKCVQPGGSSYRSLNEFITKLHSLSKSQLE